MSVRPDVVRPRPASTRKRSRTPLICTTARVVAVRQFAVGCGGLELHDVHAAVRQVKRQFDVLSRGHLERHGRVTVDRDGQWHEGPCRARPLGLRSAESA